MGFLNFIKSEILGVTTYDGIDKVARRVSQKYDEGDFSTEAHTISINGEQRALILSETSEDTVNKVKRLLKDSDTVGDRMIKVRVDNTDSNGMALTDEPPERLKHHIGAEIARVAS